MKFEKRSWNHKEILTLLPNRPARILDVGAGAAPFKGREGDEVVTVDFDQSTEQTIVCDFVREWPFGDEEFDFIYASHVIEHLYPQDRDRTIMSIFRSLKRGGLLFIRVPHRSSIQGTGWEHYTLYGLNGLHSLTHGRNPYLPKLDSVSVGVWFSGVESFYKNRSPAAALFEIILNKSHRLTDQFLCLFVGGIPEVQALFRRP